MSGMNSKPFRRSDRQRVGLRGDVRTCIGEFSITEFAEDGKILFWQGNICSGSKSERQYSYDNSGRILSIQGGTGDHTDNFQYEHGRRKRIRTVPASPERERSAFFSVNVIFESTEEGEVLSEGGTVTTVFNDWDEPAESEVRDSEGHLLSRITHEYNPSGQLVKEVLVREVSEFTLPKRFRDQIPPEQREAAIAQMRGALQKSPLSDNVERSYIYNEQGAVAKCHMQMNGYVQDISYEYNEHGDISEMTLRSEMTFQMSGGPSGEQYIEIRHVYAYDQHGNWTEQTTSSRLGRDESFRNSSTQRRQLVYY